jgi:outer membrane protein TolC
MRVLVYRLVWLGAAGWLTGCANQYIPEGEPLVFAETRVAPPPQPESGPLSVEEAVRRAILCNPRIQALHVAVQVAEQQKRAVSDVQDPELGLAWGRDISDLDRYRTSSGQSTKQSGESQTTASSQTKNGTSTSSGGATSVSTSSQTKTESSTSISRQSESESGVTAGSTRQDGDGWKLSARFFVPNPWILGPRADARRADICAAKADRQSAIWFVTCEVRRLYAEVCFLKEDMELAAKQVRLSADILKAVQEQEAQGAAVSSDVVTVAQRYLRTQDDFDQLRYRYKVVQRGLAALLNQPPEALMLSTNAVDMPVVAESIPSFEKAELTARHCRGDVVALGWRTLAAKAAYREARNVRMPWIKEISASYRSSRDNTWGQDNYTGESHESGTTTRSATGVGREDRSETSSGGSVDTAGDDLYENSQTSSSRSGGSSERGLTRISDHGESEEWWIGFAVDVPIFSWVKNHADDVRLAEYKLACATEGEGVRLSRQEIRDALDELAESRQQRARYQRDVAPIIASMRQALATLNSAPHAMPDKVAATELQIVESLRFDLGSRKRHLLALINLEYVTGAPLFQP